MWADNETSEDLLGFKVHADLLIDVIKDDKILPVTIGVFGDWGSGKSSVLKIVYETLKGDGDELKDDTFVLYFNGWVFEGYDDAKAALLESIIKAFDDNKTLKANIKDKTLKLFKSVKWMRVLGLGFKKVVLPTAAAYFSGGASLLLPFLADQLSKATAKPEVLLQRLGGEESEEYLKSLIKDQPEAEDETMLVREFRDDFAELIEKSTIKKLVVIIDDLDRCTPDRIIENLEAIKLFLNVEKTAFVIGADPRIVRHAIEHRYRKQDRVDESTNERIVDDYLEKLIQVPYFLPKLSDSEVETYISLLVCKRELQPEAYSKVFDAFCTFRNKNRYSVFGFANIKTVINEEHQAALAKNLLSIPSLVPIITQTLSGNPRQIKRFLNTLTLRQRLATVAHIQGFNDAILAKLMVLEYAELLLFKQLYEWQTLQQGIPLQLSKMEETCKELPIEDAKAELEKINLKSWAKDRVINWLKTDPLLGGKDLSDYFWLSRDKLATAIPGTSLVPPVVKALYEELNQDNLSDAISKKIIAEKYLTLTEFEKVNFLEFASQALKRDAKRKRVYDIFHLLMDANIADAEKYYGKTLFEIQTKDIPVAIGQALKRYDKKEGIKEFTEKHLLKGTTPVAKAYQTR